MVFISLGSSYGDGVCSSAYFSNECAFNQLFDAIKSWCGVIVILRLGLLVCGRRPPLHCTDSTPSDVIGAQWQRPYWDVWLHFSTVEGIRDVSSWLFLQSLVYTEKHLDRVQLKMHCEINVYIIKLSQNCNTILNQAFFVCESTFWLVMFSI